MISFLRSSCTLQGVFSKKGGPLIKRAAAWLLVLPLVFALCVLALLVAIRATLLAPGAYSAIARQDAFVSGARETLDGALTDVALYAALPPELLIENVTGFEALLRRSVEDIPLLLGGETETYSASFDAAPLRAALYSYAGEAGAGEIEAISDTVSDIVTGCARVADLTKALKAAALAPALFALSHAGALIAAAALACAVFIGALILLMKRSALPLIAYAFLLAGLSLLIPPTFLWTSGLADALAFDMPQVRLLAEGVLSRVQGALLVSAAAALCAAAACIVALKKHRKHQIDAEVKPDGRVDVTEE